MMPVSPISTGRERQRAADHHVGEGRGVFIARLAIDEHRADLFDHAVEIENRCRIAAEHRRGPPVEFFLRDGLRRRVSSSRRSAAIRPRTRRNFTPRAFGLCDESGPDHERETEQQDRLAAVPVEELCDRGPSRAQDRRPAVRSMPKTVSVAKLPTPRMAAPRAVSVSPAAADSAASSTRNGRRWPPICSFRIDASARVWRKAVVLSIDDAAGLLAGGRGGVQLADDLFRRHGREQKVLEHRHRQRRDVGQRLPRVRRRPPNSLQEAAIRRAGSATSRQARAESTSAAASFSACGMRILRAADQGVDLFVNRSCRLHA